MEEYRRWEDNIKMDLKEIGVDAMSWHGKWMIGINRLDYLPRCWSNTQRVTDTRGVVLGVRGSILGGNQVENFLLARTNSEHSSHAKLRSNNCVTRR